MLVVINLLDQVGGCQVGQDLLAAVKAVHAGIGPGLFVHGAGPVHDIDRNQIVALTHLEVIGIVGRCHLDDAGPELRINKLILDHHQLAAQHGQNDRIVNQVGIALVLGVDGNRDVTQQRLGSRGGHDDMIEPVRRGPAFQLVANVVELAIGVGMFAFFIRERGVAARTPVDDVVTAVDQILVVQAHEHFGHRIAEALVHRETLALPVTGRAQPLQLANDGAAILFAPVPDTFDEGIAPQVLARLAFLLEGPFHDVLGRDTGVVRPGHPDGVETAHAVPAHQDILDGVVQGMPHVQDARHIGRRDHHAIGFALT